jgi:hypothetical protein
LVAHLDRKENVSSFLFCLRRTKAHPMVLIRVFSRDTIPADLYHAMLRWSISTGLALTCCPGSIICNTAVFGDPYPGYDGKVCDTQMTKYLCRYLRNIKTEFSNCRRQSGGDKCLDCTDLSVLVDTLEYMPAVQCRNILKFER